MDLRSKLKLYNEKIPSSPQKPPCKPGRDIDALVTGKEITNDWGSCYIVEKSYPLSFIHGGYCLGNALNITGDNLAAVGGAGCEKLNRQKLLYLDTETTGLSGGAGTVAFLVGTGFFDAESFKLRQYFIRDYNEEPAMLKDLHELFSAHQAFVTFNGKSFDINLLQSRFISNRFKPAFREMPNVDLLYPSRKVWGLKLESCRLSSLEENVLGHFRCDDIPGAMIPSVYFKYLADRDAADIRRVIYHNELDILSMVSLLIKLSSMLQNPFAETDREYELLGLGRLFEASGRTDTMIECLEACTEGNQYSVRSRAVKRLTYFYKREGNYDRALEHWRGMEQGNTGFEMFHLVEMAKYYEHKAKDLEFALTITDKAMQNLISVGMIKSREYESLKKRKERIKQKLDRSKNK